MMSDGFAPYNYISMSAPPPCRIGCSSLFRGIVTALYIRLMVQFAARPQSFSGSADLAVVLAIFGGAVGVIVFAS